MKWIGDHPKPGFESQLGQDRWVLSLPWKKGSGFFVDLGAGDGVRLSNSLALEQRGWTGLCLEPSEDFEGLQANRKCHVLKAVASRAVGETVTFFVDDVDPHYSGIMDQGGVDGLRSIGRTTSLETTTLTKALDDFEVTWPIDYLSLDTEGSEESILQGLDMKRFPIRVATIEHNFEWPKRQHINDIMQEAGLVRVQRRLFDDWYISKEYFGSICIAQQKMLGVGYTLLRVLRKLVRVRRRLRARLGRAPGGEASLQEEMR
jgi:FkbM family methyltransferase